MPILTLLLGGAPEPVRDASVAAALADLTTSARRKDRA
jgi:hypothetical protein